MRKQTKKWTTKDGRKIRICDMSDEHLLNTLKFLKRTGRERWRADLDAMYSMSASFSIDSMAYYACEQDIVSMERRGFSPFNILLYKELCNDAERRELKVTEEVEE